jgi:hypothetical protein
MTLFAKPDIGTHIRVKTRYNNPSYHSDSRHSDYELTGEVLAVKWLKPNEFAVTNPLHPNRFSIISLDKVIDLKPLDGSKAKIALPTQDYQQWTVTGSKGNTYLVIRTKNQYTCTCPGYTYRKNCRHISEVGSE